MQKLIHYLIIFKHACQFNHWSADGHAQHLLLDRLSYGIDDMVNSINPIEIKPELLNPKSTNTNLLKISKNIIKELKKLQKDDSLDKDARLLLGNMEKDFLFKLALVRDA